MCFILLNRNQEAWCVTLYSNFPFTFSREDLLRKANVPNARPQNIVENSPQQTSSQSAVVSVLQVSFAREEY